MGLSGNPEMSATCFAPLEEIVSKVKLMKAGGCSEASPWQNARIRAGKAMQGLQLGPGLESIPGAVLHRDPGTCKYDTEIREICPAPRQCRGA